MNKIGKKLSNQKSKPDVTDEIQPIPTFEANDGEVKEDRCWCDRTGMVPVVAVTVGTVGVALDVTPPTSVLVAETVPMDEIL